MLSGPHEHIFQRRQSGRVYLSPQNELPGSPGVSLVGLLLVPDGEVCLILVCVALTTEVYVVNPAFHRPPAVL